MPTIYTGSYKIPMEAGKGLGQIAGEKESYTRGVEQARLDIQKKQIADNQMMRKLARIDAEEKETRRQLEWESIAKRSREATEESKRRFEVGRTELTASEQATQERLKLGTQTRTEQWDKTFKRLEDATKTSKEQWDKSFGKQKEQWAETHKLNVQKLAETKRYRETLDKLKAQKPTLRETERVKGVVKKEQGVVDYYEGTIKGEGALQRSETTGFSDSEKAKMSYSLRAYNKIQKAEGKPELELVKEGSGFGSKWRLKQRIVVKDKDGNLFTIPESQLDDAIKQGYTRQ